MSWNEFFPRKEYSTLNEMLTNEKLDLLMIGSPNHLHLEHIKIGLNSGIVKFVKIFNKKMMLNEKIKIIVNKIQSSWFAFFIFSEIIISLKYLNRRRNIDVIPRLLPVIISWKKPMKNKIVLDGIIPNLIIHKYIIIEITFGVAVSKIEKRLNDDWRLIKKNKRIKKINFLENVYRISIKLLLFINLLSFQ